MQVCLGLVRARRQPLRRHAGHAGDAGLARGTGGHAFCECRGGRSVGRSCCNIEPISSPIVRGSGPGFIRSNKVMRRDFAIGNMGLLWPFITDSVLFLFKRPRWRPANPPTEPTPSATPLPPTNTPLPTPFVTAIGAAPTMVMVRPALLNVLVFLRSRMMTSGWKTRLTRMEPFSPLLPLLRCTMRSSAMNGSRVARSISPVPSNLAESSCKKSKTQRAGH